MENARSLEGFVPRRRECNIDSETHHQYDLESAEASSEPHTKYRSYLLRLHGRHSPSMQTIRQAALHNLPIPAFRQNARQSKPIQASKSELPPAICWYSALPLLHLWIRFASGLKESP
jgi:hypothetical protein